MSAIVSRGRRGGTIVPNWRWEDPDLDPYDLRIAGWLASHADGYCEKHVTRNAIAQRTGVSGGKVSSSLQRLESLGIIALERIDIPVAQGGRRLRIVFDFTVWEADPSGHVVTAAGHVVTASKDTIKEEQNPSCAASVARKPDDVFDALVRACSWEYDEMTPRQRKTCGVASSELKKVGATAVQVLERALVYRHRFPNVSITPMAIANNWAGISPALPIQSVSTMTPRERGRAALEQLARRDDHELS